MQVILDDVSMLEIKPDLFSFTSDYFDKYIVYAGEYWAIVIHAFINACLTCITSSIVQVHDYMYIYFYVYLYMY